MPRVPNGVAVTFLDRRGTPLFRCLNCALTTDSRPWVHRACTKGTTHQWTIMKPPPLRPEHIKTKLPPPKVMDNWS